MALSKEIKAALEAWKKGEGDFPGALETGMFFDDDKGFLDAAGKRFDGKVKSAEKAARDAATAEILKQLNIDDPGQIAEIKERLEASSASATELQKIQLEAKRIGKELEKAKANEAALLGFKNEVLKDRAISPLLSKVHPDFRNMVRKNVSVDLVVDGDKVNGPDGKDAEAMIEALLKETPSLKAPEIKPGSGTNGNPAKGTPPAGGTQPTNGQDKRPAAERAGAEMLAMHEARLRSGGQA